MHRTFADKEAAYHRRVIVATPLAVFLVGLLFLTSDVVPYSEIEKRLGWEGKTQRLLDISIIPDTDDVEVVKQISRQSAMKSVDVDLLNEKADAQGGHNEPVKVEDPKPITTPELDFLDIRLYPAHTDVPYSDEYVILHMVKPEYPPYELLNEIEGDVTVEILVNEEGAVENAWILSALGPRSFEIASLAAVRQFRFKPPLHDGEPVPMWIRFHVRFRLVG